jgi:hypothetical protein
LAATDACNNKRTVGSDVFCAVHAEVIQRGLAAMRGRLMTAARIVGGWCETATSQMEKELVVRQSPASKTANTEAEEAMALETVQGTTN